MSEKDNADFLIFRDLINQKMKESYTGSEQSYDLWFKHFQLRSLSVDSACFVCESDLKRRTIEEKFHDFIASSLFEVLGYKPEFTIEVDESLVPQYTNINPIMDNNGESESDKENEEEPVFTGDKRFVLNDNYTFENFVVGSSNSFAHAAALNVANYMAGKASSAGNPLFIWGPSGLGKTHLMYAIANRVLQNNPDLKVIYVKGEDFMNEFIESIPNGKTNEFRIKYRRSDVLLIDDIQYIAGKESTQREFFHTFDALYEDGKQIIITSDRPPKELTDLTQRIRSRFEAGLLADIQPPDYELRIAILRDKIKKSRLDVPIDVVNFLATNLQENIRQLEGVVKKLAMSNMLSGNPVNMEMVRNTVPEYLRESEPVTDTVNRILEAVAHSFNVTVEDILGDKRNLNIKNARNVAMYLISEFTKRSLNQIGDTFSRNHSTVFSNISRVKTDIESDPVFESKIKDIIKQIKN